MQDSGLKLLGYELNELGSSPNETLLSYKQTNQPSLILDIDSYSPDKDVFSDLYVRTDKINNTKKEPILKDIDDINILEESNKRKHKIDIANVAGNVSKATSRAKNVEKPFKYTELKEWEKKAFNFFKEKGLGDILAAAIVGNLRAESNGDPDVKNFEGSGATGLQLWLGARLKKLNQVYGPKPTFELQLEYLWDESSGKYPGLGWNFFLKGKHVDKSGYYQHGRQEFLDAKDLETAVMAWNQGFGRPGKHELATDRRVLFSKNLLDLMIGKKQQGGIIKALTGRKIGAYTDSSGDYGWLAELPEVTITGNKNRYLANRWNRENPQPSSERPMRAYVDDNGNLSYRLENNISAGFLSASDPVGELVVGGAALNKPVGWLGKKVFHGIKGLIKGSNSLVPKTSLPPSRFKINRTLFGPDEMGTGTRISLSTDKGTELGYIDALIPNWKTAALEAPAEVIEPLSKLKGLFPGFIKVDKLFQGKGILNILYNEAIKDAKNLGLDGVVSGQSLLKPLATLKARQNFVYKDTGIKGGASKYIDASGNVVKPEENIVILLNIKDKSILDNIWKRLEDLDPKYSRGGKILKNK